MLTESDNKRIGNLEFRKATYLLPDNKLPEHISYHIDCWYPNPYYGHDEEYPEDPSDNSFRIHSDIPYYRIHKECFKRPESCFAIASFDWDKEGYYEVHFIGDRPLEYLNTVEKREQFWELLKYGDELLNKKVEDEE